MKIYYDKYLKDISRKLRKEGTLGEVLLWNELKGRKILGYQFMRQKPIKKYVVDFFCSKLKLIIEVDGESHYGNAEKDKVRQDDLEQLGLHFLRFDDLDVKFKMDEVLEEIKCWIVENAGYGQPPSPLF